MRKLIVLAIASWLFFSCSSDTEPGEVGKVTGLKPVYISKTTYNQITTMQPQVLEKPGKIYIYQQYAFVNELNKGVHIIDNTDPYNPVKIKFISIPGNKDMAVKNGILYADNFTDVVAINIRDVNDIKVTKRLKNILPLTSQLAPEFVRNTYFECADTTKGYVVDWIETELENPKCYIE
jgi:hypothetical protein